MAILTKEKYVESLFVILKGRMPNQKELDFFNSRYSISSIPEKTLQKTDISDFNEQDYATTAQGNLADTALQAGDSISNLTNDLGYISSYIETDPIFQSSEAYKFVLGDKLKLDNQSGTNTGDETLTTLRNKRPFKTLGGQSIEGTGDIDLLTSSQNASQVPYQNIISGLSSNNVQSAIDEVELRVESNELNLSSIGDNIPYISMVRYSNVNTSKNINLSTSTGFITEVPIFGSLEDSKNFTDFTRINEEQIIFNFNGRVEGYISLHVFSLGQRNAIQIRRRVNGVAQGPVISTGYIRASSSHNESSLYLPININVSQGDILRIGTRRESSNGTSTRLALAGSSEIVLKRVN